MNNFLYLHSVLPSTYFFLILQVFELEILEEMLDLVVRGTLRSGFYIMCVTLPGSYGRRLCCLDNVGCWINIFSSMAVEYAVVCNCVMYSPCTGVVL